MSTAFANRSESVSSPGGAAGSSSQSGGTTPRRSAVSAVTNRISNQQTIDFVDVPAAEYYSSNVFTKTVMKDRLPKSVFKSLMRTIDSGEKLDPEIADVVASAVKDWAMEKGATHYAHIFYPLTGITAE